MFYVTGNQRQLDISIKCRHKRISNINLEGVVVVYDVIMQLRAAAGQDF